ncbi:MAG: TonB-dependent receptor [Flavobacteriaceae bacterium]|nr:TonB-dependent receptor [Flavobacteriaceae bacterium]
MKNQTFSKFIFVLFIFFGITNNTLFANAINQEKKPLVVEISGKVTDNNGDPLPGATVLIKGTSKGTTTDFNGYYKIDAPIGATLAFRYLGYNSIEILIGNQTEINVVLIGNNESLEEVVVVGYGRQKKSDITGAVSSVSKDRINDATITDPIQLIQGAVAGLNVSATAAGSNPESGGVLLVRGRNSISANNEPLIVLDGVPYSGNISEINSQDIESIEVLKDASSTAIYGSRASNGVILIQTKNGEEGKVTVRYDGFYSVQTVANFPDLMNGDEYVLYKEGTDPLDTDANITEAELAVYESGSYKSWTWKDLIIKNGFSQQHNLSVSGGSQKTSYRVSFSYLGTEGIVINDQYKRGNTRINVTSKVSDWLTVGSNTMLGYADNSGAAPSFVDLFNKSPLAVPFNEDGSINITPISDDDRKINPIETSLYDDLNKKYTVSSNNYINIELPFVKGLSYRFNTGVQYQSTEKNWYRGLNTGKSFKVGGEAEINKGDRYSYVLENIVSYQRDFGKHNVFLTGVYSIEENENKNSKTEASGFANDFLSYYGIPQATNQTPSFFYAKTDLISQMFRANYSYDSRYLFTATVRRDGFSGFGANNKFGTFPSIALGWNISNENFFSNAKGFVNLLKLRGSYGLSGNQAISPYQTISQLSGEDYIDGTTTAPGFVPSSLGTPGLGWETTRSLNVGIDFGLLNSRISGEINLYRNNTKDLLLKRSISAVHGVNSVFENIGETQNEGFEFLVNSNNISKKDFKWSSNLNFSFIRTEIKDLYGDGKDDIANKWFIGQNILTNYDLKFIGVWQLGEEELAAQYGALPGYAKYEDLNDNGVYDPGDRQILGSEEPNFTWGFTNTFKYKDFGLSIFVYGKNGARKVNPYKDRSYLINREYWTPDNPSNEFWSNSSAATRYLGQGNYASVYDNADFIRIKDITLSYSLPKAIFNDAVNAKIYFTGKNLATITNWSALDPELDNQRAIPLQREFIFGLNLSF